jgi:hypothetical protein
MAMKSAARFDRIEFTLGRMKELVVGLVVPEPLVM